MGAAKLHSHTIIIRLGKNVTISGGACLCELVRVCACVCASVCVAVTS